MAEYNQADIQFVDEASKTMCLAYIGDLTGKIEKLTQEVDKLNMELEQAKRPVTVDDLPSEVLETIKHQGEVEEVFLSNIEKDMDDRAELLARLSQSTNIGERRKFLVDRYFERNNMSINTSWTPAQYDSAFMSLAAACQLKSQHSVTIEKQRGNMTADVAPRAIQFAVPSQANTHFANPFASTKDRMLGIAKN